MYTPSCLIKSEVAIMYHENSNSGEEVELQVKFPAKKTP